MNFEYVPENTSLPQEETHTDEEVSAESAAAPALTQEELDELSVMSSGHITVERERELLGAYQKSRDEHVADLIVKEYEWLAKAIVRRLLNRLHKSYDPEVVDSVDVEDLWQAARLAIVDAAGRMNRDRETRFSTYAGDYAYFRALNTFHEFVGAVRIPKYKHIEAMADKRSDAEEEGYPKSRIAMIHELLRPLDPEMISEEATGDEDGEFVKDIVDLDEMSNVLLETITNELTDRERDVLVQHWELFGSADAPKTFKQISLQYGVSKERIREIEVNAMRRLRRSLAEKIAAYIGSDSEIDAMEDERSRIRSEQRLAESASQLKLVKEQVSRVAEGDLALEIFPVSFPAGVKINIDQLSGELQTQPVICDEQGNPIGRNRVEGYFRTIGGKQTFIKSWVTVVSEEEFAGCHIEFR